MSGPTHLPKCTEFNCNLAGTKGDPRNQVAFYYLCDRHFSEAFKIMNKNREEKVLTFQEKTI